MKIADIQNKRVKISSHSITVKDERDKTCGVVRDVKPYRELRPAEQMEYFKNRAQVTKALDMLWDNAKVTDAEEKAEETTEA